MSGIGRREFIGGLAAAAMAATASGVKAATQPNILLLIADDLGDGYLGCYGHPTIRTTHLDTVASQGTRFTNAFVTTSSCSPSRTSLFTGRYPHATGAEAVKCCVSFRKKGVSSRKNLPPLTYFSS